MKKIILITVAILMAIPALAVDERQRVRSIGMATIHNNLVDIAREKAIDNALRQAVEKVVGVMITATTEVENYQVKLDRILSEARGFVENYKILGEKREGDNYEVIIDADIVKGKLEDRMKALALIMERKAKPRLMIIFSEQTPKEAVAEAAMSRLLIEKGFKLVDAQTLKRKKEASSEKALTRLASQEGAEILITGIVEASTQSFVLSGIEMFTNKVNISLKVINADTGDVITTDSETLTAPGPKGDFKKITEQVAEKLTRKLIAETLDTWSVELANTVSIKLIITGLSDYQELLKLKDQLPLVVKGFKNIYQRAYQQGEVDLDIVIKGTSQGLADDLSNFVMEGKRLKIIEMTPNKITAALTP